MKGRVFVGLVHWPILDRAGTRVVTNVTNFDIHDIARTCRSFGVEKYFIINKMREQLMYVSRVLDHWRVGMGAKFNPMRRTALGMVEVAETLEEAISRCPPETLILGTSARSVEHKSPHSFRDVRGLVEKGHNVFLVFGTGFGLAPEVFDLCQGLIEPIRGQPPEDYRHLSVRAAVSICLDRILGQW